MCSNGVPMRGLSAVFMEALLNGHLRKLLDRVKVDPDLELFIRRDYIDVYFKGAAILKLSEVGAGERFRVSIDDRYACGLGVPATLESDAHTREFLNTVPMLKERVLETGKYELEFEQLFSRVNNRFGHNGVKSEYYIVDRQYVRPECEGARPDILAIRWDRTGRNSNNSVTPVLVELKYGLNNDIQHLHQQIGLYITELMTQSVWPGVVAEMQELLRQRAHLGLFGDESAAIAKLEIANTLDRAELLILLIDSNPYSQLYERMKLGIRALAQDHTIRVARLGLALWDCMVEAIGAPTDSSPRNVPRPRLRRFPVSDFKKRMYGHLVGWKQSQGFKSAGKAFSSDESVLLPHIYPPIRDAVQKLSFKRHKMFSHIASSQAACLNLFLPLLLHKKRDMVLRAIRPEFCSLDHHTIPGGFCFEYCGPKDDTGGPLGDKTDTAGTDSDLAIAYLDDKGEKRLWLLEHKLTEQEFTTCGGSRSKGRNSLHNCEKSFNELLSNPSPCYYESACKYNYWKITNANRDRFLADNQVTCPFRGGMNQLWRNQLLGLALQGNVFEHAHFSVVKHPGNDALDDTLNQYRKLIGDQQMFSVLTSADVVNAARAVADAELHRWADWYSRLYNIH